MNTKGFTNRSVLFTLVLAACISFAEAGQVAAQPTLQPTLKSTIQPKALKLVRPKFTLNLTRAKLDDVVQPVKTTSASRNGRSYQAEYTLLNAESETGDLQSLANSTRHVTLKSMESNEYISGNDLIADLSVSYPLEAYDAQGALADYIDALNDRDNPPFTLALQTVMTNGNIQDQRNYLNTTVREFTIGALDASARTAPAITVKTQSRNVNTTPGNGAKATVRAKPGKHVSGNFRMFLGQLPSNRISSISAITVTPGFVGTGSDVHDSVSEFTIAVANADAPQWRSWIENSATRSTKYDGRIEILSPNLADAPYVVELYGVSIRGVRNSTQSNSNEVQRTLVTLKPDFVRFRKNF